MINFYRLFCLILFIQACSEPKDATNSEFVQVNSEGFSVKGEPFFPLILNYVVQFRIVKEKVVLGATWEYEKLNTFEFASEEGIKRQMNNHFGLIKKMGFNTVRIIGLDLFRHQKEKPIPMLEKVDSLNNRTFLPIAEEENVRQIISSINQLSKIAEENGLKLMFLLPRPLKEANSNELRLNLIKEILRSQKNNPTIFAYDFFNEPLYFDNAEYFEFSKVQRLKKEAVDLVRSWKKLMNRHAPNQLMTISYAEPIEVFEWDPGLLELDFVSFHTYSPLRVPNEIYWFSKFAKKPWVITETSLPADNDSISYASQAIFMKEVLQRVVNCGGSGFGWWQFQDVEWGPFEHNYTALLNHDSTIINKEGDTIEGTIKPAVNALKAFKFKKTEKCKCWVNYENMLGYKNYLIEGKIISRETKEPIEGALIRGWTKDWSIAANTFTDENGQFKLYSNTIFENFEISAVGKQTLKFSKLLEYIPKDDGEMPLIEDVNLEYHNIHYQEFIPKSELDKSVLNFDKNEFNQYKYKSEIPLIQLTSVEIE